jgi:anti-sigma regulatory factor (Ser/Thr protein kinase)
MRASFRHEAFLYESDADFVAGTLPFIADGIAAREPVMVMLDERKISRLREELGPDLDGVEFRNMTEIGRNPARIIPAWREFISERAMGRPFRGIGEPIWASRTAAELAECSRHEALLNLALEQSSGWLLCPYDAVSLVPGVLDEARRNHPFVREGSSTSSRAFRGLDQVRAPFDAPLGAPAEDPVEYGFGPDGLHQLRRFVADVATALGLQPVRVDDLVLAANEVAANSVIHGGGGGTIRVWKDDGRVVCEIDDDGRIDDPLVGRIRPRPGPSGHGLWVVNQLCDLVELRSGRGGTVVRLHVA